MGRRRGRGAALCFRHKGSLCCAADCHRRQAAGAQPGGEASCPVSGGVSLPFRRWKVSGAPLLTGGVLFCAPLPAIRAHVSSGRLPLSEATTAPPHPK